MLKPTGYAARHRESDVGEALQSDVMRFMAILSLCLVAIFALVQSLPLRSLPEKPTDRTSQPVPSLPTGSNEIPVSQSKVLPDVPTTRPEATSVEPVVEIPAVKPIDLPVAVPAPAPTKPATSPEAEKTAYTPPTPVKPSSRQVPAKADVLAPENPAPAPTDQGLALRFASDDALLALLAQRKVDVYARTGETAWQLLSTRGVLTFSAASAPNHFHHMSPDTVPQSVTRALARDITDVPSTSVTFAVTLPADMTRKLKRLVNRHKNGLLVIHADGGVQHQSTR